MTTLSEVKSRYQYRELKKTLHEWITIKQHIGDVKEIFAEFSENWCTAEFCDPDNPRKVKWEHLWNWLTDDTRTIHEISQILRFFGRNGNTLDSFIHDIVYDNEENETIDKMTPIYHEWLFLSKLLYDD